MYDGHKKVETTAQDCKWCKGSGIDSDGFACLACEGEGIQATTEQTAAKYAKGNPESEIEEASE